MANLSTVIILTGVVLLSACSDENSGLIEASGAISATPDLELESTPESTPTPAAATPDESNSEANTANQPPTSSENAVPSTTAPNISFQGTSLQSKYGTGDTILLDGRHSTVDGDTLISFQWTQVDTGAPMVALLDASTATASFVATA